MDQDARLPYSRNPKYVDFPVVEVVALNIGQILDEAKYLQNTRRTTARLTMSGNILRGVMCSTSQEYAGRSMKIRGGGTAREIVETSAGPNPADLRLANLPTLKRCTLPPMWIIMQRMQ